MLRSIQRALSVHRCADPTEAAHLSAMRELLGHEARSCDRDHFDPGHFTASAFVLSPDRQSLLLVHHRKLQRWLQPGGHLEPTDVDVVAAARREVLEETGLDDLRLDQACGPLLDVDVHRIPAHRNEPAHLHHDLRLLFVAPHLAVIAGQGVQATRWVSFAELDLVETDDSVRRAVSKIVDAPRRSDRAEA